MGSNLDTLRTQLRSWLPSNHFEQATDWLPSIIDWLEKTSSSGATPIINSDKPLKSAISIILALELKIPVIVADAKWGEKERSYIANRLGSANYQDNGLLGTGTQQLPEYAIGVATGGTSGLLRIALHSKEALLASARAHHDFFRIEQASPCCCLPLHHISGLMQLIRSFYFNGQLILHSWKALESEIFPSEKAQQISLVPTQLHRLLRKPATKEWLKGMTHIFLGGAPSRPDLIEEAFREKLRIAPCYGMTETASMIAAQDPDDFLLDGQLRLRLMPHATVSIRDVQASPLDQANTGRIYIQSTSLFIAYLGKAPAGDYFASDDVGSLHNDGTLSVQGRLDGLINTGGEKVNPLEVSKTINAIAGIRECLVFGQRDSEWGNAVAALIISPKQHDKESLKRALSKNLASWKIPKVVYSLPDCSHSYEKLKMIRSRLENPQIGTKALDALKLDLS